MRKLDPHYERTEIIDTEFFRRQMVGAYSTFIAPFAWFGRALFIEFANLRSPAASLDHEDAKSPKLILRVHRNDESTLAIPEKDFDLEALALADQTATLMERVGGELSKAAEYIGEFHRLLKLVEYTLGILAAIVTLFVLFAQPEQREAVGSYVYVLDLIVAVLLIVNRAYFSSLGQRHPEILWLSAAVLKSYVPDLRITATEPYNEITEAKLRQQLRAALPVLGRAEAQFPFAVWLLAAESKRERRRIFRKLLLPDGSVFTPYKTMHHQNPGSNIPGHADRGVNNRRDGASK